MQTRQKRASWHDTEMLTAAGILATAAGALLASRLPTVWTPRCLFKAWTGYPCLTCGAYRCITALSDGRVGRAFRVQPLLTALTLASGIWVLYAVSGTVSGLPRVRVQPTRREAWLLAGVGAATILANWAYLITHGV